MPCIFMSIFLIPSPLVCISFLFNSIQWNLNPIVEFNSIQFKFNLIELELNLIQLKFHIMYSRFFNSSCIAMLFMFQFHIRINQCFSLQVLQGYLSFPCSYDAFNIGANKKDLLQITLVKTFY
jgi:hypothetical protein